MPSLCIAKKSERVRFGTGMVSEGARNKRREDSYPPCPLIIYSTFSVLYSFMYILQVHFWIVCVWRKRGEG